MQGERTLFFLSALLDNNKYGYHFRSAITINHLLYVDDIKLYVKGHRLANKPDKSIQ